MSVKFIKKEIAIVAAQHTMKLQIRENIYAYTMHHHRNLSSLFVQCVLSLLMIVSCSSTNAKFLKKS